MKEWTVDGREITELTDAEVWRYFWWSDYLSKEDADELEAEFDRRGFKIEYR